jgi:acetyltransferase
MNQKAAAKSLDAVFRPRSIAVVGASRRASSIGQEILKNIVDGGFTGPVYPVNPRAKVVCSMRSYPSLASLPEVVDLAILVVPRDHVLKTATEAGKAGVKGLITITAGFREVGGEGEKLEAKLKAILDHYKMRMVGPNCMGVVNTEPEVRLNATFAAARPTRGNVGFISQSGALGEAILADAVRSGLGVSMFASIGNKTDISGNDMMEYWEHNDDVQVILMYLESFGNPRRFTEIARRLTRHKPVITVKAGRTAAGATAASSHTGSLVELDVATDSLLEQCGVLRVSSLDEMFVQAQGLASQPVPKGDRIALVTNAGGPAILCTDACVGRGLRLAELTPATMKKLRKVLPSEASVRNPVDMIASADANSYRATLDAVSKDPNVDAIIAIFVSPIMIDAFEVAKAIAEASDGKMPMVSVFMGKQRSTEGRSLLSESGVPVYRFPEEAAAAMSAMCRYRALRDRPKGRRPRFKVDTAKAKLAIRRARRRGSLELHPSEVRDLLSAYGFRLAQETIASTPAEAIAAAQGFGYPVVLKAVSEKLSHKTDVGGVKLDLRDADDVGRAFTDLTQRLRGKDPKLKVAVQPMVRGRELLFGMARDPQFGPLLMFGMGGIYVETLRDVTMRIHPIGDVDAKEMIRRIRGYPLLVGVRGEAGVPLAFVEQTLLRLSFMVTELESELEELDINPMMVGETAQQSFVVDARVSLRPR